MQKPTALQGLQNVLPTHQIVTDPVELITYEVDAGLDRGKPAAVVLPHTTEDVVRLARWAAENNIPLIARGAGTGLSGGAVAERGGVIVSFSRMNRLVELDASGRRAVVEPGIPNLALDEQVKAQGLYFPPDPASQRASTIGGNAGENAGGPHCFKYGVMTNYVTGLQIVLADGRAIRVGGRALDYPEYDFAGLIVGGEGTLGMVTSFDLRLVRNPPGVKTMMAIFDSVEQAGVAVSAVIAAGLVPATMEMMDRNITRIIEEYAHAGLPADADAVLIIEADGHPAGLDTQIEEVADILTAHGGRDLRIAQSADERDRIWLARKSAAGAITRLAPAYYLVDITVPRSRLAETLAEVNQVFNRSGLRVGYVFHAGDGNLHPLILIPRPDDRELIETAVRAGRETVQIAVAKDGSITGEHGVGIEKREFMAMMYSGAELAAMWDVKQVFDPRGLMNPGKVFPTKMPEVVHARGDGLPQGDVFTPATAEEAARGLAALSAAKRPVFIGNLAKQPSHDSVSLSTSALNGIKKFAPDDLYVTVGAGTPFADVQAFLEREKKLAPLASPWAGATIGGIVAANMNAPLRMRYGSIRDLVLCATVALADGRVIRAGRPVVKNVAGYDMPKVFVGAFGTLGLITDVTLKLTPMPRARRTALVPVDDLSRGLAWSGQLLPLALVASAMVLAKIPNPQSPIPNSRYVLAYTAEGIREDVNVELDQVTQTLRATGAPAPIEVEAPTGTDLWTALLGDSSAQSLQVRVGVAPKDLAAYVKAQSAALASGAFLADVASGFVYAAASPDNAERARAWVDALREPALNAGGYAVVLNAPESLRGALDVWGFQPETLDLMRALKARWDPAGILNPGVFVA